MRKLSIILAVLLLAQAAWAAPVAGVAVQNKFATSNVGTTTWVPVVTSSSRGIKAAVVYNSSPSPIEVGIAFSSASAGSEVQQFIIPGLQTGTTPVPVMMPFAVGYGTRISVRALGSTASTGELDMSFFYN